MIRVDEQVQEDTELYQENERLKKIQSSVDDMEDDSLKTKWNKGVDSLFGPKSQLGTDEPGKPTGPRSGGTLNWDPEDSTKEKLGKLDTGIAQPIRQGVSELDDILRSQQVQTKSIVARARNSVLQFPIYITKSIRANEAHIISKLFERVYSTLVQAVIDNNKILEPHEANNLVFLKQYHSNIREAVNVLVNEYYEPIDEIDSMLKDSIFYRSQMSENVTVEFRAVPAIDEALLFENARLMHDPLSGFQYFLEAKDKKSVSTRTVKTVEKNKQAPEKVIHDKQLNKIAADNGLTPTKLKRKIRNGESIKVNGNEIVWRPVNNPSGKGPKEEFFTKSPSVKTVDTTTTDETPLEDKPMAISDMTGTMRMLKDTEIRKLNGMQPFVFEVQFILRDPVHGFQRVSYIIGIKSVLHEISISDLSEDLREIVTGNIRSLQKVRYKTGEITFKDYMFNIKGLKQDASRHINHSKRWLNTLKRLGEFNRLHGSLLKNPAKLITGGNTPIPNGTMILAQTDVTKLLNETGIDLSNVSNVKRLAKSLFLIGFAIVDATAGTMRVLFPDRDSTFDVQSLAAIDAEVSKTDNSAMMNELNKAVNRGR